MIDIEALAQAADLEPHDMCSDPRVAVNRLQHFAALVLEKAQDLVKEDESLNEEWGPQVKFQILEKLRSLAKEIRG